MPTLRATDLIEGSSIETDYKGTRLYRIFQVTMEGGTDPSFMVAGAIFCPGIPQRYDQHPTATALIVTEVKCAPYSKSSPTEIRVIVTYEFDFDKRKTRPSTNGPCTLEFSTVMANIKATRTPQGDPMILVFDDPNSTALDSSGNKILRLQPAEADVQVPMPLITFRRREPLLGTDYVKLKINNEGHVNSRTFQHGDDHTWLCTLIEATLAGDAYDVQYQFQYHGHFDPYSWDGIFFFKEPSGTRNLIQGAPALGITFENGGIQEYPLYPEADFSLLNLNAA